MKMKRTLRYIECDIVGHCNLNCKACSHFSNIQNEEEFISLESYEKDLRRLKELFFYIDTIKILGGEPLLHPKLGEIIQITRNIYPESNIFINTNGILIKKLDKKVIEIIKECNIQINITIYESTQKVKEEMVKILKENQICYTVNDEKFDFRRRLTEEKKNRKWAAHYNCNSKNCIGFKDGLLGKCPMSIHISRFNKGFSTNYPENEFINIHDKNITAKDIKKFSNRPINLCNYCSTKQEWIKWERANYRQARKEDWFCTYNKGTTLENIGGYNLSKFPTKKTIMQRVEKIRKYYERAKKQKIN